MKKKILVIEDNTEVRENLAEILELSDYEVVAVENGKIGVEQAIATRPDLILCDVMMPELDGFGVLHILEKKPEMVGIPFIFLTAKSEMNDFRKGMNLGADDYITKPFDDVELLDAIKMRLQKSEKNRRNFSMTQQGLRAFINEAKGQEEMTKLSENREVKKLFKKDFLYHEGSHPKQLFFISSGKLKTFRTNDFGKEYITNIYSAGEFIGYNALLQNNPYQESCLVIEDAEVNIIPKEDFSTLLYSNRDFSSRFIKMLANDIDEKEAQLLSLAYNSIRKRVAEALLTLYAQNESENQDAITILREDLASMVGTAKESVIRTISDLKKEGLIEVVGGSVRLLNVEKLKNLPG